MAGFACACKGKSEWGKFGVVGMERVRARGLWWKLLSKDLLECGKCYGCLWSLERFLE